MPSVEGRSPEPAVQEEDKSRLAASGREPEIRDLILPAVGERQVGRPRWPGQDIAWAHIYRMVGHNLLRITCQGGSNTPLADEGKMN
jgi:hypothetical protein